MPDLLLRDALAADVAQTNACTADGLVSDRAPAARLRQNASRPAEDVPAANLQRFANALTGLAYPGLMRDAQS